MATLTQDTLLSSLSISSGDTIDLAGFNLIVDMDAVATPVSIVNSGGDANLEFADVSQNPNPLGNGWPRIKLNATLPANVHPYIDPAHPLPVSDDAHAIDGDGYRTTLTANARAEIQLAGNFGLGGGTASLPTETREGAFWAKVSSRQNNTLAFDRFIDLHVGDKLYCLSKKSSTGAPVFFDVSSFDGENNSATFDSLPFIPSVGHAFGMFAGGVCIYRVVGSSNANMLTADIRAGTILLIASGRYPNGAEKTIFCDRIAFAGGEEDNQGLLYCRAAISARQVVTNSFLGRNGGIQTASVDELACRYITGASIPSTTPPTITGSKMHIAKGICGIGPTPYNGRGESYLGAMEIVGDVNTGDRGAFHFCEAKIQGYIVGDILAETAGTLTRSDSAWFHAPATASDVTWRYADRTVKPHSTLRIRALWKRAENSAATAAVAITVPSNWYAGTKGGALAETVFDSTSGADWTERLVSWRNDGEEDAQVRVWECVTGDTAGGYLRTIEATGGPM